MTTSNRRFTLAILLFFSIAAVLTAPFLGMKTISVKDILQLTAENLNAEIYWRIRLPRILTAFLAGAALAISGMAFQAMFRNPLATPFTLGVSSGAAFGAALFVKLGLFFSIVGVSGQALFAFLGAMLSIGLVYGISRMKKGFSTTSMLVAGVAINFFFSSLILFIQYLSDFSRSFQIIRWLMGGFEIVGFQPVLTLLPFVLVGSATIFMLTHELNLLTLGEDLA
ncbi:MAG: iron ABC transporter permease, partial [bacterium]|nr:iron ABC transporter permease [bacterium]